MCHFQINGGIEYKCGGTLINRRYVLTAAHCHNEEVGVVGGEIVEVSLGEFDVGRNPDCKECRAVQRVGVEQVVVHGEYRRGQFL